jgi:diguanylate cyclase (GGDEF)-like protein
MQSRQGEAMAVDAKILIVDDEPHIRRILQFLLEQEGFAVQMAGDGEEALSILEKELPDLILLDVMMPKMDGFSVLERIRANFETSRLPVIMLTAKGESAEKVRGLKGGANDYLTKPFNHEELLLRMRNMLAANQAQRDANPLTGLPGNRAIERACQLHVEAAHPFSFMYIDIDRFKGFNDHYGYSRGDEAISLLAKVLRDCCQTAGLSSDFIGHVGGDDFVVITESPEAASLARLIIEAFDRGVRQLHDPEDYERGYLRVKNRAGIEEEIPLITITVALVENAQGRFKHMAELSDAVAELKRYGKTQLGSVVVKERRTSDEGPVLVSSSRDAQQQS